MHSGGHAISNNSSRYPRRRILPRSIKAPPTSTSRTSGPSLEYRTSGTWRRTSHSAPSALALPEPAWLPAARTTTSIHRTPRSYGIGLPPPRGTSARTSRLSSSIPNVFVLCCVVLCCVASGKALVWTRGAGRWRLGAPLGMCTLAKLFEAGDHTIFGWIRSGGHALKHVAAAMAMLLHFAGTGVRAAYTNPRFRFSPG